jgi:Zn-dependent M28 family amino/carboxypeptidase
MLPFRPSDIIRDASSGKASDRKIMDGIIHSGVLNTFQVKGVDGLVHSGIPEHKQKGGRVVHGTSPNGGKDSPILHKSKKPATPYTPGHIKFPGSSKD